MSRLPFSILAALIAVVFAGCKRDGSSQTTSAGGSAPRAAPLFGAAPQPPDDRVLAWLLDVLRGHQITGQRDGDWVTVAGTKVGLTAAMQPADPDAPQHKDFVVLQVNFFVRLPDGRVMMQPVVGFGPSRDAAIAHAEASFLLGTFHALLRAFIDPDEHHVLQQERTIGGRRRIVTFGDIVGKSYGEKEEPATTQTASTRRSSTNPTNPTLDKRWQDQFLKDLDATNLPPGTHWIDVYNGFAGDKQELEIQLDSQRWPEMEAKMRAAPWPHGDGLLTSVRQFIVVQDPDDPTRPKTRPTKVPATTPAELRDD